MPSELPITTSDGVRLGGLLYRPEGAAHTALLINSGTGIPQGFYRRFAAFAAARGFVVLTFDYRGIGASRTGPPRRSRAVYRDWGQLDIPAAIHALRAEAPGLPLAVVGHSTGGQQLGLADTAETIDATLLVAVSTGYWRGMPLRMRLLTWLLWRVFVPLSNLVLGYFPARLFGLGESLPAGVVREWGAWCLEFDYLGAFLDDSGRRRSPDGRPFGPVFFDRLRAPIRALYFADDPIATAANALPMLGLFAAAPIDVCTRTPAEVGADTIGHLGFFRPLADALWGQELDWLQQTAHQPA